METRMRLAPLLAALSLTAFPAFADDMVDLRIMSFNIWYGGVQANQSDVIEILRASDADIIGLQEPDGQTAALAAAAGYPYVDLRRHIISRLPLFDPKLGERTDTGQSVYPLAGLDADAPHVWAMVAPGKVVALGNLHLTSDPYGPDLLRDGSPINEVLQAETDTRLAEIDPYAKGLEPLIKSGTPVIVTGDFNTPSHLDYTTAAIGLRPAMTAAVAWPVTLRLEAAGFTDTFRAAHPDPVARPGLTYSPGFPWPVQREGESLDRIDYIFAANAAVRGADVWGEPNNPDVDKAFPHWPSDHRAIISDLTVTPTDAPAMLAVEPRLVPEGTTFVVRGYLPGDAIWGVRIVPRGGDPATQTITSVEGLEPTYNRAFRFSTLGLTAGPWDAVLIDEAGTEQARTRFSILGGDGKPSLSVATPTVKAADPITVSWTGAPGLKFDWIGVYAAGDPNLYDYLAFAYTGATLDGSMELTPDLYYQVLEPGDYELRLMSDDHYVALATASFEVTE
jgi:exonuclease III